MGAHRLRFSYLERNSIEEYIMKGLIGLVLILMMVSTNATSQEEVTYCTDMRGSVVIVTDYVCPDGYWPM
tara:strand:+ start:652 stop:861 length:210 start_codon:yes stop_codon:yes gene_type:complete